MSSSSLTDFHSPSNLCRTYANNVAATAGAFVVALFDFRPFQLIKEEPLGQVDAASHKENDRIERFRMTNRYPEFDTFDS